MSDEHDVIMECCDDCSREFEEGTMEYTNANDNYVCDACSEEYVTCYDCGDRIHQHDSYYPDAACDYYCEDCYHSNFVSCSDCSHDMYYDDAEYHENHDAYYCDSCYPPNDDVEWNVYSHNYVQENDDFVNPTLDGYAEDTFNDIKSKRYVGIEIETNYESEISNDDVTHYIRNKIRRTRINSDNLMRRDTAVYDGSVTNGDHPFGNEVVMQPRRGDRIFSDVDTICRSLKQLDAYVSVKCGLHLHVDTRDYDWYHFSVLTMMTKLIEPHVYTWVPPSRLSGQWSRPVSQPVSDFRYVADRESFIDFFYDNGGFSDEKYNNKRYHGLNLHCHFQANQGTEIRYHGGTLNPDKIKHWTIFWTNVIDTCYDIAEELRHQGYFSDYSSFGDTPMFKSLVNTKTRSAVYQTLQSKYGKYSVDYGESTDINQYKKHSELLRRYLRLPKKDKPYLVQPMLDYVKRRQEHSFMSIQNIFELFNIPTETQKFFQNRTEEILGRNDDHFQRCFNNKKSVVEFDRQTMTFKHVSSLPSQFLTIDTARITDDWLPFSALKDITDDASVFDLCEFVLPNVSEYQVRVD